MIEDISKKAGITAVASHSAEALSLASDAALQRGEIEEAISLLQQLVTIDEKGKKNRYRLAGLLLKQKELGAAAEHLKMLLAEDPDDISTQKLYANTLLSLGEDTEARIYFEQMTVRFPEQPGLWLSYGYACRSVGRRQDASAAFRKAINLQPFLGSAYWGLVSLGPNFVSDNDIEQISHQLAKQDLSADNRSALQFALGKVHEDRGDFKVSWDCYAKANALLRLTIDYNPDVLSAGVVKNKSIFTRDFFLERKGLGCESTSPIFIVGRQRSGSTLIEQILSSHSQIEGAGELPYMSVLSSRLGEKKHGPAYDTAYIDALTALDAKAIAELGETYLRLSDVHRKQRRPYFVDKKPGNFLHLGMILTIFPNVKVIDARRNPAAASFSMFKTFGGTGRLRLGELGQFYRDYIDMMAHFDAIAPGKVHRVFYEDMATNPEKETRRLFDYLELPFEEQCLRFYQTDRVVLTPSAEQVRKPISRDAIDHWRNYEPWLGQLIRSLGSVFDYYPELPPEFSGTEH